jgi:UDP-2-acetamido-3-amino-2,3-dideoxy-glucuronate N-acetyltransferase
MDQSNQRVIGRFSIVKEDVRIGEGSRVWNYCKLYGCAIGKNTQIGSYCEIKNDTTIGDFCRIQSYVSITRGVQIGSHVFLGPRVTILNDKYPTADKARSNSWTLEKVVIEDGATIGGGAIILPGVKIGSYAVVGAGSVVTKNVPSGEIWMGNPARFYKKRKCIKQFDHSKNQV